jgi:SAM-dependent methyltransferase
VTESPTFAFGENWQHFLTTFDQQRLNAAMDDLAALLGRRDLTGLTFLDIGCGSGLSSAAALALGASSVYATDVDHDSVAAATELRRRLGDPPAWRIEHGSILDPQHVRTLPHADIVYSWGVLHHTGAMWTAIEQAASLVDPGREFAIAIYNRTPVAGFWRRYKALYNRSPDVVRRLLVGALFVPRVLVRLVRRRDPFRADRGMSVYHDAVDWAGGYPYECASFGEIVERCGQLGLRLVGGLPTRGSGCNQFLFRRN